MSEAASIVLPYFEVKWYREGIPASEALQEGKAAAIRCLQAKIDAIHAMTFDQFQARCLHDSVKPETTNGRAA